MVVADCATGGQAEPDLRSGFGAVASVEHQVFLIDSAAFTGGDIAAIEPGGDLLLERRLRQKIARELFEGKLIKWFVAIEGFDDPIAVSPHLAIIINVNPVGIGVTSGIEPVTGPMLAPMRRTQQPLDHLFVGVR